MSKNRFEYYRGRKGQKYGIYNTKTKRFQFGICEDTPMLAEARLFQMIGDDARKWRFEPRALPNGRLPNDGMSVSGVIFDEPRHQELKEKAVAYLREIAPDAPAYAVEIAAVDLANLMRKKED